MVISIFILLIFLSLTAFMSCSETSLFSLSSFTLATYKAEKNKKKKLVYKLLFRPRELLVVILVLNILANILVQNTVSNIFKNDSSWLLKVGLPLFLILLFGEILPKSIAINNNKKIASKIAPILYFFYLFLKPIVKVLTTITNYISRLLFFFMKKETPISTEELVHIIEFSKEKGVLNLEETEMISGFLKLQSVNVKELMANKSEIVFYDVNKEIKELIDLFNFSSQLIVCNKSINKILGTLCLKSFIFNKEKLKNLSDIKKFLEKPFFVPETTNGLELFFKMREEEKKLAIVVDEYGSVTGIISQKDLIEKVIGESQNLENVSDMYVLYDKDIVIAEAKMELSDFEDIFKEKLKSETYQKTIGGWLIEQTEKILQPGEKFIKGNFLFYVLEADPNKIKKIYIKKIK